MPEPEPGLRVLEVLAARKADFLRNLQELARNAQGGKLSTYEVHRLDDALARLVAEMDPRLFVSPEEAKTQTIVPGLALGQLGLDSKRIWSALAEAVSKTYPELAEEFRQKAR